MSAAEAARIQALLTLYRESHYDVEVAHGRIATLRVGEPAPAAVLQWMHADRTAFYITACNPNSRSLPREENEQRLEALRTHLRERGYPYLEGVGHLPGEMWREYCVLVRSIAQQEIDELARIHEQNGIVVVRAQSPTVLRLYRPDWHATIGDQPDIEWA